MSEARSPIELLGAIIDEVEGLRRTDPHSHLPDSLLREARAALGDNGAISSTPSPLSHGAEAVGRTVAHVFDNDLIRGELVMVFTDGGFMVWDAESDSCGEDPYIVERYIAGEKLSAFVRPRDLHNARILSDAEYAVIKREEAERAAAIAKRKLDAAKLTAEAAERDLLRAKGEAA